MQIIGYPTNTDNQKKFSERHIEIRNEVVDKVKDVIDKANVSPEVKQLVFDVFAELIVAVQEDVSAVFRYASSDEK